MDLVTVRWKDGDAQVAVTGAPLGADGAATGTPTVTFQVPYDADTQKLLEAVLRAYVRQPSPAPAGK